MQTLMKYHDQLSTPSILSFVQRSKHQFLKPYSIRVALLITIFFRFPCERCGNKDDTTSRCIIIFLTGMISVTVFNSFYVA